MLRSKLIHPDVLAALGRAGHGSKVLIADGNYPFSTKLGRKAALVNLNLMSGLISCTQVLEALVTAIPIEAAAVMQQAKEGPYAMKGEPNIWAEFRKIMRDADVQVELAPLERFAFYEAASSEDVALTIATAEQRIFANLLLTIGVLMS